MSDRRHGPGPIVHGSSLTNPGLYIVEHANTGQPELLTLEQIQQIPIRQQWFSGTQTGCLASWWSREVAEQHATQIGAVAGQILPIRLEHLTKITKDTPGSQTIVILADAYGRPLHGA